MTGVQLKYKQSLSSLSNVFDFILDINILLKHHNINTTWMFNIYKYNYILYTINVLIALPEQDV